MAPARACRCLSANGITPNGVLRLQPGDLVELFDGSGVVWSGRLVIEDSAWSVELVETVEPGGESPSRILRLYQGLGRSDRMEWVLQKATELGVASDAHLGGLGVPTPPAPRRARLERWNRILAESCKQMRQAPGSPTLGGTRRASGGGRRSGRCLIFLPGEATGLASQALGASGESGSPEPEIWTGGRGPESGIEDRLSETPPWAPGGGRTETGAPSCCVPRRPASSPPDLGCRIALDARLGRGLTRFRRRP